MHKALCDQALFQFPQRYTEYKVMEWSHIQLTEECKIRIIREVHCSSQPVALAQDYPIKRYTLQE